MSGALQYMYCK